MIFSKANFGFLLGLMLLVACHSTSDDLAMVSVHKNQFVTEENNPILFHGLNISDPDNLEKKGQWNQRLFDELKAWNANIVRLPIHPNAWRERGKENYMKLLDNGIKMAKEAGMYVILDWHSIGNLKDGLYQSENYNTTIEETYDFWISMAKRYGSNPNVAMFELFNEPTLGGGRFGESTWKEWKSLIDELVKTIRDNGAKNVILVGGFDWAYDLTEVLDHPITGENIAYVSHPYPQKRDKPWTQKWEKDFGHVAESYPVFLTEIGYCEKDDKGAHVPVISDSTYVDSILSYAQTKGISYCVWIFDPSWSPMLIKNWDFEPTEPGQVWKNAMSK